MAHTPFESSKIVFLTGKVISANNGIVGIDAEGNIFDGYDGTIENYEHDESELTCSERVELANMMVARWQAYRDRWSR